jgi:RNA polymerase sigma factor (sigma-70 family)
MNSQSTENTPSDAELWDAVLRDDTQAFESVVKRYQGSVSAVAYCILNDLTRCQDITQETFWIAWRNRNELREKNRLGGWLTGIARNLARQNLRAQADQSIQDIASWDVATHDLDPAMHSMTHEENELVWKSLDAIPEIYREAIAIYYRQGESIAAVAEALEITTDAAKQRLGRGREQLKGHLAELVQDVLSRSRPTAVFTARVMAGVAAWTAAAKAGSVSAAGLGLGLGGKATLAQATTGSTLAWKSSVATGAAGSGAVGFAGGLLGGALGLGGAWFGSWVSAQMAHNVAERKIIEQYGRIMMRNAILFTVSLIACTLFFLLPSPYSLIAYFTTWAVLMTWFFVATAIASIRMQRKLREVQKLPDAELEPNRSMLRDRLIKHAIIGRKFTSGLSFLGWPLIDIQFSDVRFDNLRQQSRKPARARGWIAIGDQATGLLLAIGGTARGLIALGGFAFGGIAFGGVSLGLISVGGAAMGLFAMGGGSVGYDAIGGAAIGWHSAAGGLAVAKHVAVGGLGIAMDVASGGGAIAKEANTAFAKEYAKEASYIWMLEWYNAHPVLGNVILIGPAVFISLITSLFYRRVTVTEGEPAIQP